VKIIREGLDPYRTRLTDAAVLTAVGEPAGLRILDAGCGEGYLSRLLASAGADVVGVDTSASLIAAAGSHADQARQPVNYAVAAMENLPEPDETFDVVVCNHVLSDVDDPEIALAEIARVLKPGGRLVAMMLHPCFYTAHAERDASGNIPVTAYFTERRVDQKFLVAGIESPDEVHMTFRPLEFYTQAVVRAGLLITGLTEPHPDVQALHDDPWWRANFVKPLFLLISAAKR
jgi:SAM-dependent methyltransferase